MHSFRSMRLPRINGRQLREGGSGSFTPIRTRCALVRFFFQRRPLARSNAHFPAIYPSVLVGILCGRAIRDGGWRRDRSLERSPLRRTRSSVERTPGMPNDKTVARASFDRKNAFVNRAVMDGA